MFGRKEHIGALAEVWVRAVMLYCWYKGKFPLARTANMLNWSLLLEETTCFWLCSARPPFLFLCCCISLLVRAMCCWVEHLHFAHQSSLVLYPHSCSPFGTTFTSLCIDKDRERKHGAENPCFFGSSSTSNEKPLQVDNQWRIPGGWYSATCEWVLVWNLLHRISWMIWVFPLAQSTIPLVNALRFLRGRLGWRCTPVIFGWYFRFLIQNIWCVIYSKIYGYGKYPPLMMGWEWRLFWIKSGSSFILLYSPIQVKLHHHHHYHHCQIIG